MARLYELIWKRMIASQMESARIERTTVDLESADGQTGMRATGQVVLFPGYLAVYEEGRDDEGDEDSARLPVIEEGAAAKVLDARADQHFTEPPPRYSEASLGQEDGRAGHRPPSTYASVLTVLRDRAYVKMEKQRFIPEDKGRLVTAFLEQFFRRYVEYDFTAALEEQLDLVSDGKLDWKAVPARLLEGLRGRRRRDRRTAHHQRPGRPERGPGPAHLPGQGRWHESSRLPDLQDRPAVAQDRQVRRLHRLLELSGMPLHPPAGHQRRRRRGGSRRQGAGDQPGDRPRGVAEERPLRSLCRRAGGGRQRDKPKRSSLPKGWVAAAIDLEKALRLLSLPREVGAHPDDGKTITARPGPVRAVRTARRHLRQPGERRKTSSTSA